MSYKNIAKVLALSGIISASPATSFGQMSSSQNKDEVKTQTIPQRDRTVKTNFGTIDYSFSEEGMNFKGSMSGLNCFKLLPSLYDNMEDGSIVCGPISSFDESNLLDNAQSIIKTLVVEEIIAQDLQKREGVLGQQETEFLKNHRKDMASWGLESIKENGNIVIKQKDPLSGTGKIVVQNTEKEKMANFMNYVQKSR